MSREESERVVCKGPEIRKVDSKIRTNSNVTAQTSKTKTLQLETASCNQRELTKVCHQYLMIILTLPTMTAKLKINGQIFFNRAFLIHVNYSCMVFLRKAEMEMDSKLKMPDRASLQVLSCLG